MSKVDAINILDGVMQCDFVSTNKDHIISIMFDLFMDKKCLIYICNRFNKKVRQNEKILLIRYIISVNLNGKEYDVPILIYLPRLFPSEAPEIYIERADEIGVNPKSANVDKSCLKICVPNINNWNMSTSNLAQVLNEILIDFTNIFPVYRLAQSERGKYNYGEDCMIPKSNIQLISFDAPSKQEVSIDDKINNQPQPNISGGNFGNSGNNFNNIANVGNLSLLLPCLV